MLYSVFMRITGRQSLADRSQGCYHFLVDSDSFHEYFFVQEFVVVVQQNRGVVHGGETKGGVAFLETKQAL